MELDFLANLAREAGKVILDVYGTEFSVRRKEDDSPLTLADTRSHDIIVSGLQSRYPDIPVLSEEGLEVPYDVRKRWPRFWCVDPLDGTKEFVNRGGEFTVNIALIQETAPIVGVIHVPVSDLLYVADVQTGCWEIRQGVKRKLQFNRPAANAPVRVLLSRSHPSPHLDDVLEVLHAVAPTKRGSSLKFCALAAGEADFYPRSGPTSEWDTAAGQAVVTASGGVMVDFQGRPFRYNKPSLINGPFLAACSLEWLRETGILQRTSSLEL